MAGVSPILTYGFGAWGSVYQIPTLGFTIGTPPSMVNITSTTTVVHAGGRRRTCDVSAAEMRLAVNLAAGPMTLAVGTTRVEVG